MRIKTIEIKHYKAFYGTEVFNVDGKNLFIYGENGSGKSSFYYALKDFFQSSNEPINFDEVENIFLTKAQRGKGHIKVTFHPDKDGNAQDQSHTLQLATNDTYGNIALRDAISLKSFLTYKHLLGIHYIKRDEEIDLFDLLVNGVLKHFRSVAITGSQELGELWQTVLQACARPLEGRSYRRDQKEKDVKSAIGTFNTAFGKLFQAGSIENILNYAQPILDKFGHNIEIQLNYTQAVPNEALDGVERNHVRIRVKYLGKEVSKPHVFLNEARLSAIAISIYLGMIKRHIQGMPCKILFLDDIFIGLDIGNRLPLLKILEEDFINVPHPYQVFITTYDKPWYEFVRSSFLDNKRNWKCFEFYARRSRKGFEVPIVREIKGGRNTDHIEYYIEQAETYFAAADNKAAGVYLRSAFEFILKRFCFGKVPVQFQIDTSKLKTNTLWSAVKSYQRQQPTKCNLTTQTITDIDHYTKLVLNPLNHHDVNKHEVTTEIQEAISTVKKLKDELSR